MQNITKSGVTVDPNNIYGFNSISSLSDLPNSQDGLSADQLKALFDEAGQVIATYINTVLIPALNSSSAGASGASEIGFEPIVGISSTNVQDAIATVLAAAENATLGQIVDHSISSAKLTRTSDADGAAVAESNIAASAVTTAKLNDSAVTTAKIANGAVTSAKCDFSYQSGGLAFDSNGIIVLGSNLYGENLPSTTRNGRLFFKKA